MKRKYSQYIIASISVFLIFGYMNCAKKVDFLSSFSQSSILNSSNQYDCIDCPTDLDIESQVLTINEVSTTQQNNVLHARQSIESLTHLLGFQLQNDDLLKNVNESIFAEKSDRLGILAQQNQANKMNVIQIASLISVNAETCRYVFQGQFAKSVILDFLNGIRLTQAVHRIESTQDQSEARFLQLADDLALKIWSRRLSISEKGYFSTFIHNYIEESKNSVLVNMNEENKNILTVNLIILLCTAVSASPEAIIL